MNLVSRACRARRARLSGVEGIDLTGVDARCLSIFFPLLLIARRDPPSSRVEYRSETPHVPQSLQDLRIAESTDVHVGMLV